MLPMETQSGWRIWKDAMITGTYCCKGRYILECRCCVVKHSIGFGNSRVSTSSDDL